ncbi:MAG: hypothetical protein QXU88_01235 [Candidatus Woesearchaeota archaeon]
MSQRWVIYASEELDGICAAAIVLRYGRLRGEEPKLGGFFNYVNYNSVLDQMAMLENCLFFVLGFSPEKISSIEEKLVKLTKRNRIVYWSSWQPCSEHTTTVMKRFVKIFDALSAKDGKEGLICATEFAYNRFLPNDLVASALMSIASDISLWQRRDQRAVKLADIIAANFDKRQLVDALSKGIFWCQEFEEFRAEYLKRKAHLLTQLKNTIVVKSYLNKNFAFGLADKSLSPGDATQAILDSPNIDVAVVVYKDGGLTFRRKAGCAINMKALARLFGGGGHAHAADASIASEFRSISLENFGKALFFIERKIKDYLLS